MEFLNFYQYFIYSFSKIIEIFTPILKTITLFKLAQKIFQINNNDLICSNNTIDKKK